MRLSDIEPESERFRTSDEVTGPIRRACEASPDIASFHDLGESREGRPLFGVTLGYGPHLATLMAGAHADEPVGPETLRALILEVLGGRDWLAEDGGFHSLLEKWTLRIIPHVNPDGEARNRPWIERWPSVEAFIAHRVRELPGDDLEFGFPEMRPENRATADFLFDGSPISLHMSLHGMGFSEGALLLVERHSKIRAADLMRAWKEEVETHGLRLHDHDRGGEKGFEYLGPGFWTTPEGAAMRRHFRQRGDEATAAAFFDSSMEWALKSGYDAARDRHPLALVTELPLFVLGRRHEASPGIPRTFLDFQAALPGIRERVLAGEDVSRELRQFELRPLRLSVAIRLQLRAIELGLTVGEEA